MHLYSDTICTLYRCFTLCVTVYIGKRASLSINEVYSLVLVLVIAEYPAAHKGVVDPEYILLSQLKILQLFYLDLNQHCT